MKTLYDLQEVADKDLGIVRAHAVAIMIEDPYTGIPVHVTEINHGYVREDGKETSILVLSFQAMLDD